MMRLVTDAMGGSLLEFGLTLGAAANLPVVARTAFMAPR
jgi:hypothetical protein